MIIRAKRKEERLSRATFKYKSVLVFYCKAGIADVHCFTTKKAAREYAKWQRKNTSASTCVCWIDTTGNPSIRACVDYWQSAPIGCVRDTIKVWRSADLVE